MSVYQHKQMIMKRMKVCLICPKAETQVYWRIFMTRRIQSSLMNTIHGKMVLTRVQGKKITSNKNVLVHPHLLLTEGSTNDGRSQTVIKPFKTSSKSKSDTSISH